MSISAVSGHAAPLQPITVAKKNDHDGDEVNGADPANAEAKEAAKPAAAQGSNNPFLGQNYSTVA